MGISNKTFHVRHPESKNPEYYYEMCMAFTGGYSHVLDIIIPEAWLNVGLTNKDAYRWAELGNKMLFPAKVSEKKFPVKILQNNGCDPVFDQFMLLDIEADEKTADERYLQSDARHIVHSKIASFSFDANRALNSDKLGYNGRFNSYLIRSVNSTIQLSIEDGRLYSGYLADYRLKDTKENLEAYVIRKIKECYKNTPKTVDCLQVRLNYADPSIKAGKHRLAVTTFYRYLFLPYYPTVVKDTLQLVDMGFDPWISLYAALSRHDKKYLAYYSLLGRTGFKSMVDVKKNLSGSISLNQTFSAIIQKGQLPVFCIWSDDEQILRDNVLSFVAGNAPKGMQNMKRMYCLSPTKLLKAMVYMGEYLTGAKVKVRAEDGKFHIYSTTRFKELA
jgi:hypothetical protein